VSVKAVFVPHLGRRFIGICDQCGWATGRRGDRDEAQSGVDDHTHLEHTEVTNG